MLFKLVTTCNYQKIHDQLDHDSILLIANEDPRTLQNMVVYANQQLNIGSANILVWEDVLKRFETNLEPHIAHIFQYRSFKGIVSMLFIIVRLRKKNRIHVLPYSKNDKPFSTQMGIELMSIALRPQFIIGLSPDETLYFEVKSNPFIFFVNIGIFFVKIFLAIFVAVLLSFLILGLAIVTRPFIFRRSFK